MVSIIIPAWNAADWIASSIRSALKQEGVELEVVVMDDGSTDGTAAVVESINDPRIRLVRQENRGQSAAINAGVAAARGSWIKLLDADDWLAPGHLLAQMEALNGHPGWVASCRWGYFLENPRDAKAKTEVVQRHYDDPLEWLVDSLTRDEGMMGGWMWLIPRGVWEKAGGYDEELGLNNDFDFSIRLLLAAEGVRHAPAALYAYRKGMANALSGSSSPRAMRSAMLTTKRGCEALLRREDSPRIRRICANRWQEWLFKFYPSHSELAREAEAAVKSLGGSDVTFRCGSLGRLILPVAGWKGVRRFQALVYALGWSHILRKKANVRNRKLPGSASV